MRFHAPWLLTLLLPAVIIVTLAMRSGRAASARFSTLDAPHLLRPSLRARARSVLPLLRFMCAAFVIIGLARPQRGTGRIETTVEAVAIQIVVDRSGTMAKPMLVDGVRMRRLDVVKRVLKEFVLGNDDDLEGRKQDLVGLIAFATVAETICPPVRDPTAVADLADSIEIPAAEPERQTAIGDAIALAAARLKRIEQDLQRRNDDGRLDGLQIKSKLVILLTDGSQTAGDLSPLQAADLAADLGIKVYPIAVGSDPADQQTLLQIAERTGGIAQRAASGDALRTVYERIDDLEKSSVTTIEYTDFDERFAPWVMAAIAALLTEVLLGATFLRRLP